MGADINMTLHTQKKMTRITENHPSSVRKVADLQECFWQSSLAMASMGRVYFPTCTIKIHHSCRKIYHTWRVWASVFTSEKKMLSPILAGTSIHPSFFKEVHHSNQQRDNSRQLSEIASRCLSEIRTFSSFKSLWIIFRLCLVTRILEQNNNRSKHHELRGVCFFAWNGCEPMSPED